MAGKKEIKPKVLFITRCYPPAVGGMERFAKDLHDALESNSEQTLLSWGGSKKVLIGVLPYFFIKSFWILIRKDIDIIHAQDGVVSIFATILGKVFKKPVIVVIHGLDVTYANGLYQYLIAQSLKRASKVVCISQAAKDEVLKRGINNRNVHVIPLGMTDELFDNSIKRKELEDLIPGYSEDNKILLSVGRLVKRKGMVWFIDSVLPEVIAKEPNALLVICGQGPELPDLTKVINSNGLSSHVALLGSVSDKQLKILYNAADCFVMPNISVAGDMEGFGRVLLEAALCEVPVVASDLEGITEAISHNENGILVESENAQAHIKAIVDFLKDSRSSMAFGKKARQYTLQHYSWPLIAQRYLDQYTYLMQKDIK
jgi:glycosyltransferase involved in cell wall biosynthesis